MFSTSHNCEQNRGFDRVDEEFSITRETFLQPLTSYQQRREHDVREKGGEVDDLPDGLDTTYQAQEADYPGEGEAS